LQWVLSNYVTSCTPHSSFLVLWSMVICYTFYCNWSYYKLCFTCSQWSPNVT